jgi:GWxTD domain-containing protein
MQNIRLSILTILAIMWVVSDISAQSRQNYQALVNRNQSPSVFFDFYYLPGEDANTRVTILFRINHDFLNFRRQIVNVDGQSTSEFISEVTINFDIYDKDTDPIPQRPFINRNTWTSTVTVGSYEETQDQHLFVIGLTEFEIPPDTYRLIPTVTVNGREVAGARLTGQTPAQQGIRIRRNSRQARELEQRRGLIQIPDLSESTFARVLFLQPDSDLNPDKLSAMNFGRNVRYAEDFRLLLSHGSHHSGDSLVVEIHEIGPVPGSEISSDAVWSKAIRPTESEKSGKVTFLNAGSSFSVTTNSDTSVMLRHHLLDVPNHRFKNAWYQLSIINWKDGDSTRVNQVQYLSRWTEMPVSLLNLDVAIDMLRFILSQDQIREIRSGSEAERERRFRQFWLDRDPTPETDFNELMAEYYRRIDYAYQNFTTPSRVGFDSDQGKIYIVYGPPDTMERSFPPGGSATEVWTYGNQTFIFRATSGFGDFQLVQPAN